MKNALKQPHSPYTGEPTAATGLTNGTRHITVLTDEEAAAGEAVCRYQTGSFKVRVAFETEYGIIHSELPAVLSVE